MTTVTILPTETDTGVRVYDAVSGARVASGKTAGAALDALTEEYPELDSGSLVVVQRFRPDEHFGAEQRRRLEELMRRWRAARDSGSALSADEAAELGSLIDEELTASGQRAEAANRKSRP